MANNTRQADLGQERGHHRGRKGQSPPQTDANGKTIHLRVVTIHVHGNADTVSTTAGNVRVDGTIGSAKTMSGDISVGQSALGACSTMSGDITIGGRYEAAAAPTTMSGRVSGYRASKKRDRDSVHATPTALPHPSDPVHKKPRRKEGDR